MRQIITTTFAIFFLAAIVGCGDGRLKTEPVRGIVTLDGQPLEGASVTFGPKNDGEGAPGFGRTNERGEYLLQTMAGNPDAGTLPGEYTVTISKHRSIPTGRMVEEPGSGEMIPEMESILIFPGMSRYANASTTPFSATVVRGRNQFDFELTSE
ncbi:MAG: carboxypeptidase-like regulatory domain-containing protein [Planctomycetaceae bacterium]|nr:carboxypeptidase-like regulatory domain-containing protein [Planctomycetaceae bacterium]